MSNGITVETDSSPPSRRNGRGVSIPPWALLLLVGTGGLAGGGGLNKVFTPELPPDVVRATELKATGDALKLEITKMSAQLDSISRELAIVKGNVSNLEGRVTEVKTIVEERVPRRR